LYLGLAGLLDAQAPQLANRRIGLFSYGSGCTSEFFSGVVTPRAGVAIERARIDDVLSRRERISIADYERIMELGAPLGQRPPVGDVRFAGVVDHRRQYEGSGRAGIR